MDKELFKETENKVRRYYQKDKLINYLKNKIKRLDSQINEIEIQLKKNDVTLEPGIKPINYEERVQTSGDGSSFAERQAMKITEFRLERINNKMMEKEKLLEQIDQIELEYTDLDESIREIKGKYKELLEMAYKKGYGEQKIAQELNWVQSQINRKKQTLMKIIADWPMWNKVS